MKWKWNARLIFYVFTFHFFGLLVPFCGLKKISFSPRRAAKCKDRHGGIAPPLHISLIFELGYHQLYSARAFCGYRQCTPLMAKLPSHFSLLTSHLSRLTAYDPQSPHTSQVVR